MIQVEGDNHLDAISKRYVQKWATYFGCEGDERIVIGALMVYMGVLMGTELEPQGANG